MKRGPLASRMTNHAANSAGTRAPTERDPLWYGDVHTQGRAGPSGLKREDLWLKKHACHRIPSEGSRPILCTPSSCSCKSPGNHDIIGGLKFFVETSSGVNFSIKMSSEQRLSFCGNKWHR